MDGPLLSEVTGTLRSPRATRVLLWADGVTVSTTAIRAGAAAWASRLRSAGVGVGDRVVCAAVPGATFIMVLVAALDAGWTLVPVPPTTTLAEVAIAVDARATIAVDGTVTTRTPVGEPTPDARLLLATSGTSGAPRRLAISEDNLRAVLDSHRASLAGDGAVLLSVLPWHHAFGLVLELLVALGGGARLVRDASGGRNVPALLATARAAEAAGHRVTHLHAVPRTIRLLAQTDAGRAVLEGLDGGLVGGAPVDATLAATLRATRLRVGYGQTEAAPGICLGEPGVWRGGTLGIPVGCAVQVDDDGVLEFRGRNACIGEWRAADADGLARLDRFLPDRWVRTGDLAAPEGDGTFTFRGRAADSFKLDNGRYVAPVPIEMAVRARWPRLTDALLSSPDGVTLVAALSGDGALPTADQLRPALGALGQRPLTVVRVPHDDWVRTPKGEIDRRFPIGRGTRPA